MESDFDLEALGQVFESPALYYPVLSPESESLTTPSDTEKTILPDFFSSPSVFGESPHISNGFTSDEDNLIRQLVVEFECDWVRIARMLPNRTPAQVARRWTCKLDPNIKKTKWSAEEDKQIEELQQTYGNNWKLIAQHLPGRPAAAVKSRYYNSVRKRTDQTSRETFHAAARRITQMQFPFAPATPTVSLQSVDKEARITSLRKQLAGMEILMAKKKAELSKLQSVHPRLGI